MCVRPSSCRASVTGTDSKLHLYWKKVRIRFLYLRIAISQTIIKPAPPVGAGGGYMFSGRPSIPLSVRASVRPSVIHVVVLCFRDISRICWRIFAKLLSLMRLGTRWPDCVFGSKGQSSRSHHRGGGAQHSTLPSSATFSSFWFCISSFFAAVSRNHVRKESYAAITKGVSF